MDKNEIKRIFKPRTRIQELYWWVRHGIPQKIIGFPREVYWFIQRGKRGYADCDTWGLDFHLAKVIAGGIRELQTCGNSCPCGYTLKRWQKVLDQIAWTFETEQKIINMDTMYSPSEKYNDKKYKEYRKSFKRIGKDIAEQFKDEDKTHVMTLKECKYYEVGWKLFAENFQSLWD